MMRKGSRSRRVKAKDIALPASADEHPFTIIKRGFSISEVAAFVSSMSADMTDLTPQDIRRAAFTTERRGYDKAEVHAYLNRIASEIEAELDQARQEVRRARLLANDPSLADAIDPTISPPAPPAPNTPPPAAVAAAPEPPAVDDPLTETFFASPAGSPVTEPEPTLPDPPPLVVEPHPGPAFAAPQPTPPPTAEVIYFTGDGSPSAGVDDDREIMWLTEQEVAEAAAEAEPVIEPVAAPPVPAATPVAAVEPEPAPTTADAASQISELLRAAHDSAARLRASAEAEVRASVAAAQAEIEQRKNAQVGQLESARAAAEQRHAEIIHNAQLSATETRTRAEGDAARTRAAADAVMTQAKAEVHAVQALARHNLAEIEAAKEDTLAQVAEMLGLGKSMLLSIEDLDRDLAARLIQTRRVLGMARGTLASDPS